MGVVAARSGEKTPHPRVDARNRAKKASLSFRDKLFFGPAILDLDAFTRS